MIGCQQLSAAVGLIFMNEFALYWMLAPPPQEFYEMHSSNIFSNRL